MALSELYVVVGARTEEFQKRMNEVQSRLQNVSKRVTDAGKTMTKWVTGPIVGAAAGLGAMITKTAAAGDEIQKMALRTGFSTEALSEYKHAAELSGASIDSIEKAVKRMQKNLYDAERGLSTSTEALDRLGLSVEQLQGLSPEQQFDKMAMALANIEDPTLRAALAQDIFGRAGTELLPMLAAGADGIAEMRQEARDLGIVFDQEAADKAAKFNDDLDRLKKGFGGVFQELAMKFMPLIVDELIPAIQTKVVPAVQRFADRISALVDWFKDLDPWMQKIILAAVGLAAAAGPILSVLGPMIKLVGLLIPLIKGLGIAFAALTSPIGLVVAAIAGAIAIGVLLWKNWDEIKEKISELWQKFADWFGNLWQGIKDATIGRLQEIGDGLKQRFQDAISWAQDKWDSFKTWMGNLWTTIYDNTIGHLKNIADGIRERFNNIIKWATDKWDGFKKRICDIWHGIGDGIRGSVNRIIDFLNGMIRGMNRIRFDVPDWVPIIGGRSWGFHLSEIPRLHTGTRYFMPPAGRREGLAILERGEQVIPKGATTGDAINFERMFDGAVINVRSEQDIKQLAREIYGLYQIRSRGLGVT